MTTDILVFHDEDGNPLFLSNFYPSPIVDRVYNPNVEDQFSTIEYPTVENFFQAQKNHDALYKLRVAAATPGWSKKLGRDVDLRPDWEASKLAVMRAAIDKKFPALNDKNSPNVELSQQLLDTGDVYLAEGNTWGDRFWGVVDGQGSNWLGILLMARRTRLRFIQSYM